MNGRLMVLVLALGLVLASSASMSMAATGTNMTKEQWVQSMNNTPTPGIGCWTATYPNATWVAAPCSTASIGPFGGPAGTMSVTSGAPYLNLLSYFIAILGAAAVSSFLLLKVRHSPEQN